jgi:hypothetical protein
MTSLSHVNLRQRLEFFVNYNRDWNRRIVLKLIIQHNGLLSLLKFAVSHPTAFAHCYIDGTDSYQRIARPTRALSYRFSRNFLKSCFW